MSNLNDDAGNAAMSSDGCQLWVSVGTLKHLATILRSIGHDPRAAAAGWRSADPFVVACLFAALGYPVFPCSRVKRPLTRNGVLDATTDLPTLHYWVRDKTARGWCVKTGRYEDAGGPAGLWIFDVDDAAGYARLAELEAVLGPLPKTWTCMSARLGGGEHRYFAPACNGPDMKTVGHALISGKRGKIDQKGRGGYAVCAGSYHASGNRYQWADGCAPDETPLAQLPSEWVAAMDKAGAPAPKSMSHVTSRSSQRVRHVHDPSSLILGDAPDGGGFHGPIYRIAVRFFRDAGTGLEAQILVKLLRMKIMEAPISPDRDPASIARYSSDEYLLEQVENARAWRIKQGY